jgi:hypothetical protein
MLPNRLLTLAFKDTDITTNAQRCCGNLRYLRTVVKRKRPGVLARGATVLHDNAVPIWPAWPGNPTLRALKGS